ncbi:hypothetical protein ACT453_38020, partial [Bacillus sp. D-CC]
MRKEFAFLLLINGIIPIKIGCSKCFVASYTSSINATKHLEQPIFIGIMPLISKRNADFLHFEVPGITLPEAVRERMDGHETKEAAIEEGIRI